MAQSSELGYEVSSPVRDLCPGTSSVRGGHEKGVGAGGPWGGQHFCV